MSIRLRYKDVDDWVIKDIAKTDRNRAVEILVHKYREAVTNKAFRILCSNQDACEIAQEVFIRAFLDEGIFDPERKILSWLLAVTRNLSLNWRRNSRKHRDKDAAEFMYSPTSKPYASYAEKQRAEIVRVAISRLNERYQDAIHYFYYEDMSCKEIAHVMDTTESNVRKIMYRARGNLKELIEPYLG